MEVLRDFVSTWCQSGRPDLVWPINANVSRGFGRIQTKRNFCRNVFSFIIIRNDSFLVNNWVIYHFFGQLFFKKADKSSEWKSPVLPCFFICYLYRILHNKAPCLLRTLADHHLCLVIRKEIGLIRSLFCKYFEQSSTAFESEIIGEISSLLLCSYMICSCLHWYGVLNPFLLVSVSSIIGEIKKWWSTNSNNGFKNKIL